jgi:hypothetical protein
MLALRLVTNSSMFEHPEPIGDAWQHVNAWLDAKQLGYRSRWNGGRVLRSISRTPGNPWDLVPTLIWLRWPWNTGLRCVSTNGDLHGFAVYIG